MPHCHLHRHATIAPRTARPSRILRVPFHRLPARTATAAARRLIRPFSFGSFELARPIFRFTRTRAVRVAVRLYRRMPGWTVRRHLLFGAADRAFCACGWFAARLRFTGWYAALDACPLHRCAPRGNNAITLHSFSRLDRAGHHCRLRHWRYRTSRHLLYMRNTTLTPSACWRACRGAAAATLLPLLSIMS